MNRRSILKVAVTACAAVLFPWRKTKASPSWARVVDFVPSEHRYSCPEGTFDQTLRIEQLLEFHYLKNRPTGKLAVLESDTYEMGVIRGPELWEGVTRILLDGKIDSATGISTAGLIQIDDSVAASMNDSELYRQLVQAFLWSLYKKENVCIKGKGKLRDFEGNRLVIRESKT